MGSIATGTQTRCWESVQSWVARQGWPEHVETAALEAVAWRDRVGLNSMTLREWAVWAAAQGVEVTS